ncbi:hypothetical protein P9621_gp01 [Escherichia phage UAE_MI-01]|uniref:Uncharacterized protein n=1 Tax=Escherichia phage UAE_MI-01 TaxID=2823683 RepID=A0A8E5K6V4_9CAUD|nr:hypothetical protein P9621_gp01 [Escherichia phage UAE_MI-01]QVD49008.1 hypothetical protein UAEMI01_0001 [Escherichia phage UAE_MI-01]
MPYAPPNPVRHCVAQSVKTATIFALSGHIATGGQTSSGAAPHKLAAKSSEGGGGP